MAKAPVTKKKLRKPLIDGSEWNFELLKKVCETNPA